MAPLLSIGIPTYNRASRLRVMLQAILPQVAEYADKVELVVSDNASDDDTSRIVEEARSLGPVRYSRNESNIGIIANVIKLPTELANGEFVWVLGDDDLVYPGALTRVLNQLQAHPELDLFYFNFRSADYPKDWPADAVGGYRGHYKAVINLDLSDRLVPHWHQLISARNSMCTQVYAHVIRRRVWTTYWPGKKIGAPYADVYNTFPHSCMLAETSMFSPTYYSGEPVLTIFDNAQSWLDVRSFLMLQRYPQLLELYKNRGLPPSQFRDCRSAVFNDCAQLIGERIKGADPLIPTIRAYLWNNWQFFAAWQSVYRAFVSVPLKEALKASVLYGICGGLAKSHNFCVRTVNRIRASVIYRLRLGSSRI